MRAISLLQSDGLDCNGDIIIYMPFKRGMNDTVLLHAGFASEKRGCDCSRVMGTVSAYILDADLRIRKSVQNKSLKGAGIHI
jgi:hypothetical protein